LETRQRLLTSLTPVGVVIAAKLGRVFRSVLDAPQRCDGLWNDSCASLSVNKAMKKMNVGSFLAIDFETANYSRTSACAVGFVLVRDHRIVAEKAFLIRPPQRTFNFTYIHGLTWEDVKDEPTFGELWPAMIEYNENAEFLAAHNAPFDRGVLHRCCETYGIEVPHRTFVCTVQIARAQWNIYPTKLPNVCGHLGIPLRHPDAGSDARACADIVLQAAREGWRPLR
jgi:DNA polymerase-3 subunit epsilon